MFVCLFVCKCVSVFVCVCFSVGVCESVFMFLRVFV